MSNWSLTSPLLRRLERAIAHRIDSGKLWRLRIERDVADPIIDVTAADMRALIAALLHDADRRGARDADMSRWLHQLIGWLEPPACDMEHCGEHGGVGAFCGCTLERVPSRCPILRDYRKRVKERERKARAEILACLRDADAPRTADQVRAALGNRDPQNLRVYSLLDAMARDGLLHRQGDTRDGVYVLTDAGRAAAADTADADGAGPHRRKRRGAAEASS
jgi:DNA-binding PadR family transcriptional regulator